MPCYKIINTVSFKSNFRPFFYSISDCNQWRGLLFFLRMRRYEIIPENLSPPAYHTVPFCLTLSTFFKLYWVITSRYENYPCILVTSEKNQTNEHDSSLLIDGTNITVYVLLYWYHA